MASPHCDRRTILGTMAASAAVAGLPGPLRGATPTVAGDHELWYDHPAVAWTEALPLGNGRLGAMVFGGTSREHIQLNVDSLWSGGPYNPVNPLAREALPAVRALIDAGRYREAAVLADRALIGVPRGQMAFQSAGDLYLDLPLLKNARIERYRRSLDLDAAMATTRFSADGADYRYRTIISAPHDLIAISVETDGAEPLALAVSLSSGQPSLTLAPTSDGFMLSGRNRDDQGIAGALEFAVRLAVTSPGVAVAADQHALRVHGGRSLTILVAIATSFRSPTDQSADPEAVTAAAIATARRLSFDAIAHAASAAHRRLYRQLTIHLPRTSAAGLPTDERIARGIIDDPALAALYFRYGRYLLISCSRPGGQPANLQGIWNDSDTPPWGSKFTININTEMNYWPAEPTGLDDCAEPLIHMVEQLAEAGGRTAREMYGARGWVAHHNTDIWLATAPIDGAQWGLWPMGGAWLCLHVWERYAYGRDPAYLRRVYPVLKGAAQFFLDTLQPGPGDSLITNPSLSPENNHPFGASICAGPAMDRQILRDLFARVIEAAGILGVDAAFSTQVAAARDRLPADRIGKVGQLQEWLEDWDMEAPERRHRHVSHLYGLYPSHQINLDDTPELAAAARKSLELRGDESTGWATAWRIALWARLRDGERAHHVLRYLISPERTYPNLFDAHPPFQIDGNFGATAAIAEMILQCRDAEIMLLPALPSAWPEGEISGLRAPGRCTLDIGWRDGWLTFVSIASDVDQSRELRWANKRARVHLRPNQPLRLTADQFG